MGLSFRNVSFAYRSSLPRRVVSVFEDFTWSLPAGRTVLLGPNGAGKTTLLSLAVNLLRADAGAIHLEGVEADHSKNALRKAIAFMPQSVRAIAGLTTLEQVAYAAWLQGVESDRAAELALSALDRVGLQAERDSLVAELSGGQLRRVGLAQVLVRPSRVLLLDEPTAGLDPAQRSRFRNLIAELPANHTVLVSTHQVDDLTELFTTVVVLDRGRVCYEGSPADFLAIAPPGSIRSAEAAYISLLGRDA